MSHVSVVLPTFNRAGLIGETLESLLSQSRQPAEILVIDDGSQDDTPVVLQSFGDRIKFHRKTNGGKAAALNGALQQVRGDLIWICDDDDILLPDACAAMAGALDSDPTLDFCCGRHLDFTHDPVHARKDTRPPGYNRASTPTSLFADLLEGCHVFQPGLMVRRRVYEHVGPFSTELIRSQDYEMILRIARHHKGLQLDQVVFWHREHDGGRGQAGHQFKADQAADRWAEFNRRIFTELLADLQDHEVVAQEEWAATPPEARPRLAAVARATVEARQRMWPEAMTEFQEATRLGNMPLSALERSRLERATLSPLGVSPLDYDSELQRKLRALGTAKGIGPDIRRILKRSMRWRLRDALRTKDTKRAAHMAGFFLRS